jgi:hypothetical protein
MTQASLPASRPTVARVAAAALAFFLCGVVSAVLFFDLVNPIDPMSLLALRATYFLPLPFGIALWLICYRYGSDEYALLAILATVPVWIIARFVAAFGDPFQWDWSRPFLSMSLAGLTGALGVTLASATCRKYLLRFRFLAGAALVGFLAAMPFGTWDPSRDPEPELICFGIWQAGVGTYLFWVCRTQDSALARAPGTGESVNKELPHD